MGIVSIGWNRETALAVRKACLMHSGVVYDRDEAKLLEQAASDLDYRLALDATGEPTNPPLPRRESVLGVSRSVSPGGSDIPPVAGMAGAGDASLLQPEARPASPPRSLAQIVADGRAMTDNGEREDQIRNETCLYDGHDDGPLAW